MSSTNISLELTAANQHPEGFYYRAMVESGMAGTVRLHVECCREGEDVAETSQRMDLTAAECRALAKMLETAATVLEAEVGEF